MDTLTPQEIEQMKALCAAATDGPWDSKGWRVYSGVAQMQAHIVVIGATNNPSRTPQCQADCDFIAAAREFIPKAIAALASLPPSQPEGRVNPTPAKELTT